ncbi:hypothetical protein NDU88_007846 [Pleurodeles waltl]|uniref:Uncharacterized protein n=1 Tax=Pleurodeles waltl TaxID=8319 RepID=A0AAV7VQW1_PLEWA|nr:hypothetical protein NDU88_007846 [Pleurodeles waltl]
MDETVAQINREGGMSSVPEHGTFNPKVLENLRWMLSTQKPPPRPAQYEALAIWDLMALKHRQERFQRRLRRAEKSFAEARWDNESKMWRRGIVDGLKLFPAITQGEETQGKKASCKTDKDSSKSKENKRSWEEEDDSDDEEFMDRLLHDRPPPYVVSDSAPSTSLDTGNQKQEKGVTDTVQTSDTALIQNGVSVPTAPDIPIQLQPPPQIHRIYPDVPVLETTTNLIVPPDPIYTKPKLVHPVAGPPLVPVPSTLEQTYGVEAPRSLGPGQTPAAISLPITDGPPVPLYAQGKASVCDQGVMTQESMRGGSMGTPQIMAPGEQVNEQPRPLMDLSPVGAPLEAMRQAGLGVLTPQTESTNTSHSPMMHAGNISLQGFTVQQLNEWLEKTYTSQKTAVVTVEPEKEKQDEYLNIVRLGAEAAELVKGTMGVNRLESYTEAELRYLCPKITKEVGKVHQRLANLADKYNIDIGNTKHLKRSYRLDFDSKDFEHMRSAGMKAHLRELLQSAQFWVALEKWEGRRAKKKDKGKGDSPGSNQAKTSPDLESVKILPMRETAGGVLVHVPWTRGDILSFTNDYSRLREKPIEWYQQTDRFVKLAKCLWEDLNTLFEIIVPPDLWLECKRGVDWPTKEPARDKGADSDCGGRRRPPATVPPTNDRTAVKRPRRPFSHFRWAGGRSPKERPPAQRKCPCNEDAGSEWSRRSCRGATGAAAPVAYFSVCFADTEILCGALLRGPLQCPCHWHGHCRGPQGPAPPPWRIPPSSGKSAGDR